MDDLAGIDFNASSSQPEKTVKGSPLHDYAALRSTIGPTSSGRSTPLLATKQHESTPSLRARPAATTAHADSFSGLVSLNASKKTDTLSLQERQDKLLEERRRQRAEQERAFDSHFGTVKASDANVQASKQNKTSLSWNPNARAKNVNNVKTPDECTINNKADTTLERNVSRESDDNILSAFDAATPVDRSSHLPLPTPETYKANVEGKDLGNDVRPVNNRAPDHGLGTDIVDDDPFDLHTLAVAGSRKPDNTSNEESSEDILGALGKPVSSTNATLTQARREGKNSDRDRGSSATDTMQNKAISDLVDMGFSTSQAKDGLRHTSNGHDVESAVNYLLTKAHRDSRSQSQDNQETKNPKFDDRNPEQIFQAIKAGNLDAAQYASQVGSNLLKSANYLWKSGQKKVQKAVTDLQQDPDSTQPKWMRETSSRTRSETFQESERRRAGSGDAALRANDNPRKADSFTDEALMLESGGGSPSRTLNKDKTSKRNTATPNTMARNNRGNSHRHMNHPDMRGAQYSTERRTHSPSFPAKTNRELVEQESANAYVSPARRKLRVNQPVKPAVQNDTYSQKMAKTREQASESHRSGHQGVRPANGNIGQDVPKPSHSKPVSRSIPYVSDETLSSSSSYRQKGSDAYKRGDHNAAHELYSRALTLLPGDHPVRIVILCNRALTSIKIGDPKAAITDADTALKIVGPGKGLAETISPSRAEGSKDMKEFYGKALMRKAEALESLEKWADASVVWQEAIQAGAGGSISIQGRDRCEKARRPRTTSSSTSKTSGTRPAPKPKPSALRDLSGRSGGMDSQAVQKLRAANAAEKRSDDEKFALADQVDSRLAAWKGSKSDNLRALLGSLDKVLWPEAGWVPVGMSDLVMANKVKIVYMKAIAKVHPDKVSSDL